MYLKKLINVVYELVKDYISKERAIILPVITCKDEIENQSIFNLVRLADPTGSRTIGILSKPDTIEKGTHQKWIDILLGNE